MIHDELISYIESNVDAKILSSIHDISKFLSKSIDDLEKIAKAKGYDKHSNHMAKDLKPMNLNVSKAYELIGKFNMVQKPAF